MWGSLPMISIGKSMNVSSRRNFVHTTTQSRAVRRVHHVSRQLFFVLFLMRLRNSNAKRRRSKSSQYKKNKNKHSYIFEIECEFLVSVLKFKVSTLIPFPASTQILKLPIPNRGFGILQRIQFIQDTNYKKKRINIFLIIVLTIENESSSLTHKVFAAQTVVS